MKQKLFISLSGIFLFIILFFLISINKPLKLENSKFLIIEPGSSLNTISDLLNEENIYKRTYLFKTYVLITGKSRNLKSGEFMFSSNISLKELVKKIEKGDIFYREFRLKEGETWSSIKERLGQEEHIVFDIPEENDDLIKNLNLKNKSLEGLFFPDTYFFKKGDKATSILERAYKIHTDTVNDIWESRADNIGIKSSYEAVILASIIEKEGVEKRRISGVFNRRLIKGMKLQSDPTVIYALGDQFDGNIRRSDLRIKNPYNTYVYKGLPPSPIGLVSKSSIEASTNPEPGSSLYFVSKGDGTHKFSDTLQEHNEAVKRYQLKE